MLNHKFTGKAALAALLLGVVFIAVNVYLGANHYPKLANTFFVLALLSETAFVVFIVLWTMVKAWRTEPARPPMQMPKPMPGAAAPKQPPPPQP